MGLFVKMKLDLLQRDEQKWKEFVCSRRQHQTKNLIVSDDQKQNEMKKQKRKSYKNKDYKKTKYKSYDKVHKNTKNKKKKTQEIILTLYCIYMTCINDNFLN